ncbi:MAG: hypothetical protein ABR907_10400 [Terracidiphilus sp.]|jgi:hypothetical protein
MFQRPRIVFPTTVIFAITVLLCIVNSSSKANSQQLKAEDAEKFHSKIFSSNQIGTIAEHLAQTTGDITITSNSDQEAGVSHDSNLPPYPPTRLVDLACFTDAVILATPVKGVSHMTADKSFVYSEWTMQVEEVLQNTPKAPISDGKQIVVVRPGGKLEINGRMVYGIALDFPDFQPGGKYLLFLNYIPQTGDFKARSERTFNLLLDTLSAGKAHPYGDSHTADPVKSASADELVRDARAAIASAAGMTACKKEGNE